MKQQNRRKCADCGEERSVSKFFSRSPTQKRCTICTARIKKERLKQDLAERKETKALRESIKQLGREVKNVRAIKRTPVSAIKKRAGSDNKHEQELANRALCQRHLLPFIKRFVPKYDAGWVHIDICERLEKFYHDIKEQKSPRLMLFMPPRAGKSEIASVCFPAWCMGQDPEFKVIATAYASSLATDFSRKVRDRIKEEARYHALFPETRVNKNQEAVDNWATTKGGVYVAAGVDGPISGKGGFLNIIDDPIKNRQDADSVTVQEGIWGWYRSTFMTRVEPGGGILIIQTRWSDMDVSQRLIDMMNATDEAEQWEIITYPGIAEEDEFINLKTRAIIRSPHSEDITPDVRLLRRRGDALHPARYDEKALNQRRVMMGPREWSALYQQRPMPAEGEFFKEAWFVRKTPPSFDGMKNLIACDLAIGKQDYNHKTAIAVGSLDWDGYLHIREVVVDRMSAHETVEKVLDLYKQYDAFMVGIENGGLKLALQDQFNLRMRQRKLFPSFDNELTPVNDKEVRARPLQGLMQSGMVFWPKNEPWWYTIMLHQLLRFHGGAAPGQDDIVDALAWLGRMYHHVSVPRRAKYKQRKQKSWKQQLREHQRESRSAMSA